MENSGTININAGNMQKPQLAVVWERRRGRAMQVHARFAREPGLPFVETQEFFERINEQCRSGAVEHVYRRGVLEYEGLPWRGEFWLDDAHRLGPPSRHDETALIGPRVILGGRACEMCRTSGRPMGFHQAAR